MPHFFVTVLVSEANHTWVVVNNVAVVGAAAPYNITNCPTDAPDWSAVDPVVELDGPTCGKMFSKVFIIFQCVITKIID